MPIHISRLYAALAGICVIVTLPDRYALLGLALTLSLLALTRAVEGVK